jgi:hypothetical protein
MSYRRPISWRRLRAASDTTLSRKGAKLPLFSGASERLEGLCGLVLGRASFEIARDRDASTGTHLAEESVRRRTDPTTAAVPLYRCVVELRLSDGQSEVMAGDRLQRTLARSPLVEGTIRRSPRLSFLDSFRFVHPEGDAIFVNTSAFVGTNP